MASAVWGTAGDTAVPADYDGDGKADVAVFRPATGTWFFLYSATQTGGVIPWKGDLDAPVPGDFDGDGLSDVAIFRPATGTLYVRQAGTLTIATFAWGGDSDIPILKRP